MRGGAGAKEKWYLADTSYDGRRVEGRPHHRSQQQPQQQRRRYQPKQQHHDDGRTRPLPAGVGAPRVRPPRPSPRHLEINRELLACGFDAGALLEYGVGVKDEMNFFNFATCFNRYVLIE